MPPSHWGEALRVACFEDQVSIPALIYLSILIYLDWSNWFGIPRLLQLPSDRLRRAQYKTSIPFLFFENNHIWYGDCGSAALVSVYIREAAKTFSHHRQHSFVKCQAFATSEIRNCTYDCWEASFCRAQGILFQICMTIPASFGKVFLAAYITMPVCSMDSRTKRHGFNGRP